MKDPDFTVIINKIIEEWKTKKAESSLSISMNLEEQIEVLKLIKKMRE